MLSKPRVARPLSGICRPRAAWPPKSLRPKVFLFLPAYGVVFRRNTSFGQRVEKRGLADVGQAHDAALQAHVRWLLVRRKAAILPVGRPHCDSAF